MQTVAVDRRPARRRRPTSCSCARRPSANPDLLRACGGQGHPGRVRHLGRLRRGRRGGPPGRGRAGGPGRRARHPARRSQRAGRGLDPGRTCAPRSWRRTRRRAASRVASQSGQLRVVVHELRPCRPGSGISRAVSAGNAAAVTRGRLPRLLRRRPGHRGVGLAYVEGIADGRGFVRRLSAAVAERKPRRAREGRRHRGRRSGPRRATPARWPADDRVFDGACRQAGVTRAATVEEAFEAAATFATQPLPKGPNVVVLTTAGGWGVVTADAITRDRDLALLPLPDDLRAAIDAQAAAPLEPQQPGRLRRRRDPRHHPRGACELIAEHPDVDAVVYLGLGIQSNQARLMREGRFYPDHGLERIVAYHERQDARFAEAAAEICDADRQADPHRHRAGRRRPGQPRPGRGPRHRAALLRLGQPGRHRARAPLPLRPLAPAPRAPESLSRR